MKTGKRRVLLASALSLGAASAAFLAVVGSVVLTACGSSTHSGSATPPAPRGDLYQPPQPLPHRPAGTLIWAEKVPLQLNPPATVWRILYHSRSLSSQDIAVSGFAIVPTSAAPGGARPVYAWAHGSAGQADRCAPSHDLRGNLPPYGGQLVDRGAALVATDYQGLGTPGEPTFGVGIAEGHAVLDSVRATKQLPGVGRLGAVVLAGHSQGGGAALWAAQLAHSYAPRLDVRGVVALAPGGRLTTQLRSFVRPPFSDYLGATLWVIDGFKAAYGARLDLSPLTKAARVDLARVANDCEGETIARWRGRLVRAVFARDPLSVPSIVKLLGENSPGGSDPHVPIMLAQGSRDEQIPVTASAELEARYCGLGATVTRRVYDADHDGVLDAATSDVLAWINDRVHGRPAPSSCSTRNAARGEEPGSAVASTG
jgi:alpha-beta hydrolase superfamily lysophospholipase